ncbi:hypothetical protein MYX84_00860 [Acidobacteria bacterium AH-259-O06]|nr:hypothetical protein [Acidobacteria bacterium AH-259-O06]
MRKFIPKQTLAQELLNLKEKTSWSWETMSQELHRVMSKRGPSSTTLFRYASGRIKRPNPMVEQYVREAIHKVAVELREK